MTATSSQFTLDHFEPAYMGAERESRLEDKVVAARRALEDCHGCPRDCSADRLAGETGTCKAGRRAVVSSAFAHFGEEDCLRGRHGSGTIFFNQCNLRCAFCQNWDISQRDAGRECDTEEIATLMLDLQATGCHNINLVTPTHVAPQLAQAIARAVARGLRLPIVYNTSGYDSMASLRLMDGLVDIYMPDFKFWRRETARALAKASDYPERVRRALLEMHRQVGVLKFEPDGLAVRGVLVRHLVMPGQETESAAIFRWLAEDVSPDTYVNIMAQYRPEHRVGTVDGLRRRRHASIDRRPHRSEMEAAYSSARNAGLWRFDERRF